MGVLFPTILDFRSLLDDFITVFSALGILWALFDPMQTLKVTREDIKCIENSIFRWIKGWLFIQSGSKITLWIQQSCVLGVYSLVQ